MELIKLEIIDDQGKVVKSIITNEEQYTKFLDYTDDIMWPTNNPFEWPNQQIVILDSSSSPVEINLNPLSWWRKTVVGSIKEDEA